ncbi:MAG: agmatine deiminase family protein [bacterium]
MKRWHWQYKLDEVDSLMAVAENAGTVTSRVIAEGGALEMNGKGTLLLNERLMLERNPSTTKEFLEAEFKGMLGVRKIIWLGQGVAEDPPLYTRPSLESLGQAYLRMHEWEPARAAFQEVLRLRPNSGHALYGLAQSYAMAGKKAEAEKAYRAFLQSWREADESLPQVHEAKAWLKANVNAQ